MERSAPTAVFFKTNHLKQRTGLDICRKCVGLKIRPSFQGNTSTITTMTDPSSPETKNISSIVKTWLRPAYLLDFDCQLHLFSPRHRLIAMSGFTFLTINHHQEPQSCLKTQFMQQLLVFILPGRVQGGLIHCACVSCSSNCWPNSP